MEVLTKNNGYALLPYTEIDGIRNMPDSYLVGLYDQMLADRTVTKTFYDGSVKGPGDFLGMFRNIRDNKLFVVMNNNDKCGLVWLNAFRQRTAYIHFCFFKNSWGRECLNAGRWILGEIINLKSADGKYVLNTILGMTPANNKLAVKFILSAGMNVIGIIPHAVYDYYKEQTTDGILTCVTRQEK